ncbi:MAG TPA: integrase arm-type DNA-binding domain-containing protein [Stellaceae bacterium]|jgi:integrase
MTAHLGSRLTVAKVKAAGPGKHPDGSNLWLQVGPNGSKSWYLRFTLRGRTREMGLGPYPLVSLAEARDKATVQRRLLLDDVDPIEARNAARRPQRETITLEAAAKQYIAGHEAAWSPDHDRQWRSSLARYVYPAIGNRAIDSIDEHDVLSIVEPLWQTTTETASRVANRIALILDWATARKLRSGDNPARWKGHLDAILPKRSKVQREEHHAALPYARMPEFMAALRQSSEIGAKAAELMILTATRTSEARFAAWSEIDLEAALWTIPAARMKAARDHRIPLAPAAVAILTGLVRKGELVFPGLGQHAILKAVKRIDPAVTAHGFRSAFADWAAEQTSFAAEVREMALAHAVGDKVEAAYRRGDLFAKRRQLAEAWARFCAGASGKVVPLRRRAAAE